ncbi:protein FAM217B isoform X1 [Pantherophis guttatus]|uniref:Protein FAM217B isoform X1 n=1 Tax=Pantherophis guttatus TaxID=94885 RepID=A0A6P9D0G0_PANGU|nr:protein FAM217B isoform X1 [Pantherophis guttatus]
MGPGIGGYPVSLHRGSLQNLVHESHEGSGMVTSSGGKNHSSTKELKKSTFLKPSSKKPAKNTSAIAEKAPVEATDRKITAQFKEKKQVYEEHQPNRVPKLKRELLFRKSHEAGDNKILPAFKDVLWSPSSGTEGTTIQRFYCRRKGNLERNSGEEVEEAGPSSLSCQEAMFLDFGSLQMMKEEDSEEDDASDLSDSERIPIPPSPCTPPELNLRAEEIDPVCFEYHFETQRKQPDYHYPDFLPPPFNTWDLKGLAAFINTECKSEPRPEPTGFLEKYVDRLLELEWLQMQTVQAEKGKVNKARAQTAPTVLRSLKSSGKSKLLHSPSANKQLTLPGNFSRLPNAGPKKDFHGEKANQMTSLESPLKATGLIQGSSGHQRRPSEAKKETKKRPAHKQHLASMPSFEIQESSMIHGAGNMRPPKPSSSFHGSTVPLKGLPAHICPNPKNGKTNNYTPPKKASADTKLKTNGLKQTRCKFK